MGILDSSFLFIPAGNDFLIVALTARHHQNVALYILSSVTGSAIGVFLLDLFCRPEGEHGLERLMKPAQLKRVEQHVKKRGAALVFVAAVSPPPFPFTAMMAAASAFQFPRSKLIGFLALGRLVRFSIVGWLAIRFGSSILAFMAAPEFRWIVAAFAILCVVGSVISIFRWRKA